MTNYPSDLEQYMQQQVAVGKFASREALQVEAMRLHREAAERHSQIKSEIQTAIDEIGHGLVADWDVEECKHDLFDAVDERGQRRQ